MQYDASGQNSWLQRYEKRLALRGKRVEFLPFIYTFPFTNPIAAGATVSATIPTDSDSDFLVLTPMGVVTDNVATTRLPTDNPAMLFELKLETGGRLLDDRQFHVLSWFGRAARPNHLSVPLVIPARSQVTMTLVNEDSDTGFRVHFSLVGVKAFVYDVGGQELALLLEELGLVPTEARFARAMAGA